MAVTMKNSIVWDVTLCGPCKNQPFGGMCSKLQLIVTVNIVPVSLILSTLMFVAICSSKTSVFIRATRCHIPEMTFFMATTMNTSNLFISQYNS
jgi:hypothetical protein